MSTAMVVVAVMLASVAPWTRATPWWVIALFFLLLPQAMGNVMAPASEAIMSAVPLAKAGLGSGMNDVNRMVAGALGVAVAGSVANSLYGSKMGGDAVAGLPGPAADAAGESVGGATGVAAQLPGSAGDSLASAAGAAFTNAVATAMLMAAGVAFAGALLVRRHLPDARKQERAAVVGVRVRDRQAEVTAA